MPQVNSAQVAQPVVIRRCSQPSCTLLVQLGSNPSTLFAGWSWSSWPSITPATTSLICVSRRKSIEPDLLRLVLHALDHAFLRAAVFLSRGYGGVLLRAAQNAGRAEPFSVDARTVADLRGVHDRRLRLVVRVSGFGFFGVIWALGASMVIMALAVRLPIRWLGTLAVLMIVGHDLLDRIRPAQFGSYSWLWTLLHVRGGVLLPGGLRELRTVSTGSLGRRDGGRLCLRHAVLARTA